MPDAKDKYSSWPEEEPLGSEWPGYLDFLLDEFAEEQRLRDQPLCIKDGVDAEYVKYLTAIDTCHTETDQEGRIVLISLLCDSKTLPMADILGKISPLDCVGDLILCEGGTDIPVRRVIDKDLRLLAGWTKLESINILTPSLTGAAFTFLTEKNPLSHLRSLSVNCEPNSDLILKAISKCGKLETLTLAACDITDAGLKYLANLHNLRSIDFSDTKVTGDGMQHLTHLSELRSLELDELSIGDKGTVFLSKLGNLEELYLTDSSITDVGLEQLAKLNNLHSFVLCGASITVAGLKYILVMKNLRYLVLDDTLINDEAIPILKQLTFLENLSLIDTRISREGLKQLSSALPECQIGS